MENQNNGDMNEMIEKMLSDQRLRREITTKSHWWFFNFFLAHYVQYAQAPFQKELFAITENQSIKMAAITAFRGSAKSTIITLSYALWSILGVQQKKFVVILSKTQQQAKAHFANLKRELEVNAILRADLGPFEAKDDEWGAYTIVLPRYEARITAISSEQSIRGLRHGQHRPQLIIADDVEDLQSVKTLEGRDKTYQWFTGEVIPAGDRDTRIIVVGNLLHEDSLLKRLAAGIENKTLDGVYRFYPLLDESGKNAWPGKYRTPADIEAEHRKTGSESAWQREFLLKIIPDAERVVQESWIQYYDQLPDERYGNFRYVVTGIDLAISQNETADYTAMVSVKVFGSREDLRVYVFPNSVNERLDFPQTRERIILLARSFGSGMTSKIFIENVGYQASIIQALRAINIPVEEFQTHGNDKRARLASVTHLIQSGKVLFPREGARDLIGQLVGFGAERHDDLADAFAIALIKTLEGDASGYVVLPPYAQNPPAPVSRQEGEKQADQAVIMEKEYERRNFNRMMRRDVGRYRGW